MWNAIIKTRSAEKQLLLNNSNVFNFCFHSFVRSFLIIIHKHGQSVYRHLYPALVLNQNKQIDHTRNEIFILCHSVDWFLRFFRPKKYPFPRVSAKNAFFGGVFNFKIMNIISFAEREEVKENKQGHCYVWHCVAMYI